jgi:hypothetical protein
METKICTNCLSLKEIENFYTKNGKPDSQCKECIKIKVKKHRESLDKTKNKEYFKDYQKNNKEKLKEYKRQHYLKNKEKVKDRSKIHYEKNKENHNKKSSERQKKNRDKRNSYLREYNQNKRDNEPLYRLKNNLRTNIWSSIKRCGYKKSSKTYEILGCSYDDFITYLENKFDSWMNWENYGMYNGDLCFGWDIDHIIPVSSAKTEEEILKLNHYTNLQPLCSKENRDIKKNKIK